MGTKTEPCGHTAEGNGFLFVCDLPKGHRDWHRQRKELRDGPSITNWGDDGLATWASKKRPGYAKV